MGSDRIVTYDESIDFPIQLDGIILHIQTESFHTSPFLYVSIRYIQSMPYIVHLFITAHIGDKIITDLVWYKAE